MESEEQARHLARDPWIGQTLDQRYTIRSLAGQGQRGRVYRAQDNVTGARVALKRIPVDETPVSFLLEFRAAMLEAASINDARVLPVQDFGVLDADVYSVSDWLNAPTLAQHTQQRVRLRPTIAAQLGIWLADALAAIHSRGVLHLSLSPRNVFLDAANGITLSDVGTARATRLLATVTTSSGFGPSLSYLAPEQLDYVRATPAADVYAAGVIMYELLAGRLPYPARNLSDLLDAHQQPAPRLGAQVAGVPPSLEAVIMACLQPDVSYRPLHGTDLAEQLRDASTDTSETTLTYVMRATAGHRAIPSNGRLRLQAPRILRKKR